MRKFGIVEALLYGVLPVVLCACAASPPQITLSALPAVPPNAGRVVIFRANAPYESLARPYVRLNGEIAGISEPGGSFYRDVPPGEYQVTVDSFGQDVYQFAQIKLSPGQTSFVRVDAAPFWESDLTHRVDTFYTREVPPDTAARVVNGR